MYIYCLNDGCMSALMEKGIISYSGNDSIQVRYKCPKCGHEVIINLNKEGILERGLEEL